MPRPLTASTDTRLCPTCRGPLTTKRMGAAEVETCTRCRAAWFPPSGLANLIELLDGRSTPSGLLFHEDKLGRGPPTTHQCPTDGSLLGAAYWGDAHLARCDACGGIWITAHMLDTIREHLATAPKPGDPLTLVDLVALFG